ncbi:MAG: serine/threonine protein kinase, partial [Deltaproteobacteria bacterium]|nr:serine/threonine protein kinase [Deltaproteobacteria bacterium]
MCPEQPQIIEAQSKSYKVIKTLGAGGTSIVYLANDGKRDVALKILGEDVDATFKERYIQILKNEFEVLSRLRHPNIAEVYDFEYAPKLGKYFFTTEYINGADIYNYTSAADFNLKEDLFVQLLLALDYVHRCGMVVKLVDFGFATRKLASTGLVVGTPHYLAPELLVGGKEINHKIDIYAAGIVYYRLLHRAYPCVSSEVNEIIKWHREHSPVCYSESLPDYTRHLISRMIETYPPDRIESCAKAIEFINFRTEGKYKKITEKIVGLQFREGPLVGR